MNFKNVFWGIMLIVICTLFLVEELSDFDFGSYFLPIVLIVSGGMLLIKHQFSSGQNTNSNY